MSGETDEMNSFNLVSPELTTGKAGYFERNNVGSVYVPMFWCW
jgi:hypothetical protein